MGFFLLSQKKSPVLDVFGSIGWFEFKCIWTLNLFRLSRATIWSHSFDWHIFRNIVNSFAFSKHFIFTKNMNCLYLKRPMSERWWQKKKTKIKKQWRRKKDEVLVRSEHRAQNASRASFFSLHKLCVYLFCVLLIEFVWNFLLWLITKSNSQFVQHERAQMRALEAHRYTRPYITERK